MKFTSAIVFTTALLAGSVFAKSSSSSSDSDSTSSSSSSSGSSSSSSSGSSSSSDSSSSSSSSSKSKVIEDFGINGCADESAFTLVHDTFRHYDSIATKKNKVAFVADFSEINKSKGVVAQIKKNKKKQTLVLRVGKSSLSDLKKLKKSKKMVKAIKKLAKDFKKRTSMKLKYVMLPTGAPEKVVKAFNKNKVTVISKAVRVSKVKNADVTNFNGVVLVESKNAKKADFAKLQKSLKKYTSGALSLRECIPVGSAARRAAATESGAETTDTDADGVDKSAAMKAETTENVEENIEEAATTTETKVEGNSASSVAISSVISIAAIAAVSAFLL